MSFSAATLHAALRSLIPSDASGIAVALSGGADSAALLALMAQARGQPGTLALRAVHIDHGLQAAAAALRDGCEIQCTRLGVPLKVIDVKVSPAPGESVEAVARDARYLALARELGAAECLLTAHHAEDQAETVLLQMLRGAGLKGMAAMPAACRLGAGWHVRPLLGVARQELRALGSQLGAQGADDPMNADLRFDRNYLRCQVWPLLAARWPSAAGTLSRAARHSAQAQMLLERTAQPNLQRLRDGEGLSVQGLRGLDEPQRIAVLRLWLSERAIEAPSEARLHEALRQILEAQSSQQPSITFSGHSLRRYRQRLFLTAADAPRLSTALSWTVQAHTTLPLPALLGILKCVPQLGGIDVARTGGEWTVRSRQGGEVLKHGAGRSHSVQHLCQQLGVLPWMRDALPFVFAGDELLAVGDLWLNARWCVAQEERGLGIVWADGPIIV